MSLLILFWYWYDDHLASWLNVPMLGQVPYLIWFIILLIVADKDSK